MADLSGQMPQPVAFVLGGGGSLGAMQVGMLKALHEHGIVPDIVVGTSIGAMNGAVIANDPERGADRLVTLWSNLKRNRLLRVGLVRRLGQFLRRRDHLLGNEGLRRMLQTAVPALRIEQLRLPFGAVVVDVETATARTLTSGPLSSAVLASAAIPGVFAPVEHQGRLFYDGGLIANVPVEQALQMGAKSLVVLDCVFADRTAPFPRTIVDAIVYSTTVTMRQQVLRELPLAAQKVPVMYLPGAKPTLLSPLNFKRSVPLIREAYAEADRFLRSVTVDGPGLYRASDAAVGGPRSNRLHSGHGRTST